MQMESEIIQTGKVGKVKAVLQNPAHRTNGMHLLCEKENNVCCWNARTIHGSIFYYNTQLYYCKVCFFIF